MSQVFKLPKWKLIRGSLGSFYNLILVISVPIIGVGISVITALIGQIAMSAVIEHKGWVGSVGQLTTSMVIDNFGWFENMVIHFNGKRLAGLVLMLVALYFMMKTKPEQVKAQQDEVAA